MDKPLNIAWINPVGTSAWDQIFVDQIEKIKRPNTTVEVFSLVEEGRPKHLEFQAYDGIIVADTVRVVQEISKEDKFDAIVVGCFYDPGLRECQEVSGRAVVTGPCIACCSIAASLGNTFSLIVGRQKWIPKMRENVILYGHQHRLASVRHVDMGVLEFQKDHDLTCDKLMEAGRKAVEEDGAEVLILGCTIEFGFYQTMQEKLGVPVLDALVGGLKYSEMLGESNKHFGWGP
eukprot:CAMPEP_0174269338 /NCGR_PEP_ID=MMETSP0439-20130205/40712_1 /TAXON_ID=0 /ORGANISM="Stereomyxa ramosa, Strain Chinc5" /LENGTH=232 /DNA_ID=CAMNT_0015358067 /DNA_START=36 /DNA_END=730 /DNA_ORIENTATION=-